MSETRTGAIRLVVIQYSVLYFGVSLYLWRHQCGQYRGATYLSDPWGCPVWPQCLKYHEEEAGVGISSSAGDVSVPVAPSWGLNAYEVS